MKHFRLFSLFFGCWLLASCTADPGTEPGPFGENPPTAEKPHAVPVEQALEELQSVLEEIDIPAEDGAVTRSGGIRRVKNVTTVSPEVLNPDGTRSEATVDGQEISLEKLVTDAKIRNLNIVEIFQKHFAVEEVEI